MPIYDFKCKCGEEDTRMIASEDRNTQICLECGDLMSRNWTFEGSVWSPTRNGGHS